MAKAEFPEVEESKSFIFLTSIWIVPFIALVVSAWLVWQHFSKLGPEIVIHFKNSGGLEAGQSVVKFRDVPVGKITRIEIETEKEGVKVYIRMNRDVEPYLNETSRFWIVKPEVDYSGVRGLETLISGSYISMYAKKGKEEKTEFMGLESPYRDINEGSYFLLRTSTSGNVRTGTPVNYKNIQVGQVEHVVLDNDGNNIDLVIFIKREYVRLINTTTKFWVQSLLEFNMKGGEIDVSIAPLSLLMFSGITFESRFDKSYSKPEPNRFFKLYRSAADAQEKKIGANVPVWQRFIFEFEGKVAGLNKHSPINYLGFRVGEVEDFDIHYSRNEQTMKAKVLAQIDVSVFADSNESGLINLKKAVENGLRARLITNNPILDTMSIELFFAENTPAAHLVRDSEYKESFIFPSVQNKGESLIESLTTLSKKLEHLPIEKTVDSLNILLEKSRDPISELNSTLRNVNQILESKSIKDLPKEINATLSGLKNILNDKAFKSLPKELNKSLKELKKTLYSTRKVLRSYGSKSLFGDRLKDTLRQLHETGEQTQRLLRKLNHKPNSLIFGD